MEIVTIGNEDFLLRRFPLAHPNYFRPDGSVSSYAYCPDKSDTAGLSVNLERITTLKATVLDHNQFGLLRISAGNIRSVPELDCIHNPIEGNDAHSLITGTISKNKRSKLIELSSTIPLVELQQSIEHPTPPEHPPHARLVLTCSRKPGNKVFLMPCRAATTPAPKQAPLKQFMTILQLQISDIN